VFVVARPCYLLCLGSIFVEAIPQRLKSSEHVVSAAWVVTGDFHTEPFPEISRKTFPTPLLEASWKRLTSFKRFLEASKKGVGNVFSR
jgi:hypothetical protein